MILNSFLIKRILKNCILHANQLIKPMSKSIKGTKTEQNLLKSFAGESQARNRYEFFASVARKEGYEQIALKRLRPRKRHTQKDSLSSLKEE